MSYNLVVRDITHTDIALFYDGMVDLLRSHLDWHDFDSKKFKSWLEWAIDDPDTDTLLHGHGPLHPRKRSRQPYHMQCLTTHRHNIK